MKRYSLRQSKCTRDHKATRIFEPSLHSKKGSKNASKPKKINEKSLTHDGIVSHKVCESAFSNVLDNFTSEMENYNQKENNNFYDRRLQENDQIVTSVSAKTDYAGRFRKRSQVSPTQAEQGIESGKYRNVLLPERNSLKRNFRNKKLASVGGRHAATSPISPFQKAYNTFINENVDLTPVILRSSNVTSSQKSSDTSTPTSQTSQQKVEDDLFGFENLLQPTLNLNSIRKECTVSPIPHASPAFMSVNRALQTLNQPFKAKRNLQKCKRLRKSKHSKDTPSDFVGDKKEDHEVLLFGESHEQVDDIDNIDAVNIFKENTSHVKTKSNNVRSRALKTFSRQKPRTPTEPDIPWHEIMAHELVVE